MRPQQNRRIRGRGNNNNNGNNRRSPNPLTRSYESNGPDVKIRGNAQHIADKYAALARDVQAAGDRVMAENYLQHAEHYMRIILSAQPQFAPALKVEPSYEEGESDNIVDLPLMDAGEGEENLLHLVVNREAEEVLAQEENGRGEQTGVASQMPAQEAKQKMERPRRITRRRLPRPALTEGALSEGNESLSLPAFVTDNITSDQNKISAHQREEIPTPGKGSAKPVVAKPVVEEGEEKEKPRRKRRSVKNVDIIDETNIG